MDRDEVEVHKNAKKERGQYPAVLTEQAWSIKDLLYGFYNIYFQRIFGLACNHGKHRILNHIKALIL